MKTLTPVICSPACIAMLFGASTEQTVKEFREGYFSTQDLKIDEYLTKFKMKATPLLSTQNKLYPGKLYLLSVPSLNLKSYTHLVMMDFRDKNNPVVLDPNKGKRNKRYYVYGMKKPRENGEYPLSHWAIDFEIEYLKDDN